ncbi:hypothetical protein ACU4HD_20935 [Cupriavidus basilensis]
MHAPDERLLFDGKWHDGLLPSDAVPDEEAAQHARFLARVEQLKAARGSDGRKAFAIPLALASQDPAWTALDRQSMRQWMLAEGYTSPTLHTYVDYCCRDDYGAGHDLISAWAGLYYFASRAGHASDAADGAVLTWPDGLHALVTRLGTDRCAPRRGAAGQRAALAPPRHGLAATGARPGGLGAVRLVAGRRGRPATAPLPHPRAPRDLRHAAACGRRVAPLREFGFDPARHLPPSASWMVSSFRLRGFPPEAAGVPLAWDNVVHGGRGLGYVVSTHQLIRQAMPAATVFTAYCPLDAAADPGRGAAPARRYPPLAGRGQPRRTDGLCHHRPAHGLRACLLAPRRRGGDHRARACHGLAAHRLSRQRRRCWRCARPTGASCSPTQTCPAFRCSRKPPGGDARRAKNPRLSVGM